MILWLSYQIPSRSQRSLLTYQSTLSSTVPERNGGNRQQPSQAASAGVGVWPMEGCLYTEAIADSSSVVLMQLQTLSQPRPGGTRSEV